MATPRPATFAITGIGLGSFVAFTLSWIQNHSLVWAMVHAIYSWFYIAYLVFVAKGVIPR